MKAGSDSVVGYSIAPQFVGEKLMDDIIDNFSTYDNTSDRGV